MSTPGFSPHPGTYNKPPDVIHHPSPPDFSHCKQLPVRYQEPTWAFEYDHETDTFTVQGAFLERLLELAVPKHNDRLRDTLENLLKGTRPEKKYDRSYPEIPDNCPDIPGTLEKVMRNDGR